MKINEIPEKIYLSYETDNEDDKDHIFIDYMWHRHPFEGRNLENIEYTRTDAFIEKATSYIQQHWIWNTKMIEDFKNYMKEDKL
jgi:hypothetical protein